jgi:hypothetical protein
MKIDGGNQYDTWYKCVCDGYLKEQEIIGEIREIKYNLSKKNDELVKHKANSLYNRLICELENKIIEIDNQYYKD